MPRVRKITQHFQIDHGMNYQKCAKIQQRLKECAKKRIYRSKKSGKTGEMKISKSKSKKPKKLAKQKKK